MNYTFTMSYMCDHEPAADDVTIDDHVTLDDRVFFAFNPRDIILPLDVTYTVVSIEYDCCTDENITDVTLCLSRPLTDDEMNDAGLMPDD